jgi:hypothetical protein
VCLSSDCAVVVGGGVEGNTAAESGLKKPRLHVGAARASESDRASGPGGHCVSGHDDARADGGADESVAVMLRDYRMLGHDDGEGRPLRYMSLYGGMVATML